MSHPQRYLIPATPHRVEEEIKRSRFITTVAHAPTVDVARAFVDEMLAEFHDASHNCWAHVIGPPGSTGYAGLSDDGEPHGTAGRPMLTVLLHSGIGDIVAVVTRYWGGTKLGKGGLVRAYSGGVQYALEGLPTVEKVPKVTLAVVFDYSMVTPFRRMLDDYEAELDAEEFGVDVTVTVTLPEEHEAAFTAALIDMTNGVALIERV